jgi:hypothetical protein
VDKVFQLSVHDGSNDLNTYLRRICLDKANHPLCGQGRTLQVRQVEQRLRPCVSM